MYIFYYIYNIYMFWDYLIFDFVKENYLVFLVYIILLIFIFPLEDLVIPNIFGQLYDTIKNTKTYGNPLDIISNIKKFNTPGLLIVIVLIYVVSLFAHNFKFYIESFISPKYLKYLRTILFEGTVNKNQEEYKDVKSGEYISIVMELSRNIRDIFQYFISEFFPYLIISTVLILYLSFNVPELGKVLISGFMVSILLSVYASFYIMDLVLERERFFSSELADSIQDKLNNMMNIVTNNDGDNAVNDNDDLEEKNKIMLEKIMQTESFSMFFVQLIAIIVYGISIFIMYGQLIASKIKVKNMITYLLILGRYVSSIQNVNYGIMYMISYKMGIIRAHEEFMTDIFKYSKLENSKETIKDGSIRFENINFKYDKDDDTHVFKDFNLSITNKEKVAIVGRSGSGKTTLMKILIGLHEIESGSIYINEEDTKDMNKKVIRNHINYINQRTNMFKGDVIHNLRYGNDKSEEEIISLLKKYDLLTIYDKLPDGVKSDVGVSGGQLSLGMQKVTMLVRGISRETPVIILDEPLAGLDTNTRSKIMKLILTECSNKTIIVITHDKEILPHMDRVINLNELQENS